MRNLSFSPIAWEHYLSWQQQDKKKVKRINELLKDIQRGSVCDGVGKPEALKYRKAFSRRIDQANRLVYNLEENGNILIISCKGHYND